MLYCNVCVGNARKNFSEYFLWPLVCPYLRFHHGHGTWGHSYEPNFILGNSCIFNVLCHVMACCKAQLPSHHSLSHLCRTFLLRCLRTSQYYSVLLLTVWSCGTNVQCTNPQMSERQRYHRKTTALHLIYLLTWYNYLLWFPKSSQNWVKVGSPLMYGVVYVTDFFTTRSIVNIEKKVFSAQKCLRGVLLWKTYRKC